MGKENYQSNLQINLQYQILKLVSDIAKNHGFQVEIMPKVMNHAKIGNIMKNHEIVPAGTPGRATCLLGLLNSNLKLDPQLPKKFASMEAF